MRYCSLPDSDVVKLPLLDDYFVIVLSRKHPLAKEKELTLHQLQDEQFILFSAQAGITPIAPYTPIKLSLFYLKNHHLSSVASTFAAYVTEHVDSMQLIE